MPATVDTSLRSDTSPRPLDPLPAARTRPRSLAHLSWLYLHFLLYCKTKGPSGIGLRARNDLAPNRLQTHFKYSFASCTQEWGEGAEGMLPVPILAMKALLYDVFLQELGDLASKQQRHGRSQWTRTDMGDGPIDEVTGMKDLGPFVTLDGVASRTEGNDGTHIEYPGRTQIQHYFFRRGYRVIDQASANDFTPHLRIQSELTSAVPSSNGATSVNVPQAAGGDLTTQMSNCVTCGTARLVIAVDCVPGLGQNSLLRCEELVVPLLGRGEEILFPVAVREIVMAGENEEDGTSTLSIERRPRSRKISLSSSNYGIPKNCRQTQDAIKYAIEAGLVIHRTQYIAHPQPIPGGFVFYAFHVDNLQRLWIELTLAFLSLSNKSLRLGPSLLLSTMTDLASDAPDDDQDADYSCTIETHNQSGNSLCSRRRLITATGISADNTVEVKINDTIGPAGSEGFLRY
ncbi:hypothetical protein C8R46DRAFT_1237796 [Mycena filopes]|nr:hypothetical protein C8R46DRAFT_1237796 [Mycena filopes]